MGSEAVSGSSSGTSSTASSTEQPAQSSAEASGLNANAMESGASASQAAPKIENSFNHDLKDEREYKESEVEHEVKFENIKSDVKGSFNNKIVTTGKADQSKFKTSLSYSFK